MKKLLVFSMAALLVAAFCGPASALENEFGGYWRTRAITQQNFNGDDDGDQDLTRVDTRTRLYYTAILNDNLRFINKFEFDAVWGNGPLGDYGADGKEFEIKESFIRANWGNFQSDIGIHAVTWARGFIFADEFSGTTLGYRTDDYRIIGNWMKGFEGENGGTGFTNKNSFDVDTWALNPWFNIAEEFQVNPFIIYMYSGDSSLGTAASPTGTSTLGGNSTPAGFVPDDWNVYWVGLNADATLGTFGLWFTGIYQGGTIDAQNVAGLNVKDQDVKAYLLAGGASVPLGPAEIHSQAFYASGDDDPDDSDLEAFFGIGGGGVGWAYYWSEIMGFGIFDQQSSINSPNADVSNIWAVNLGATIKPTDKLSITGDLWYAQLVEDIDFGNGRNEDELGFEIDLLVTYQLLEGLKLDLVGAYLFAGDATSTDGKNDDDPYELGAQFSIAF